MNNVIWFRPATLAAARTIAQKFAVYNKLLRGARRFDWGPVYQDTDPALEEPAEPTVLAVEPDNSFNFANAQWPAEGIAANSNPYGLTAAGGAPLFTAEELATIGLIDIEGMFENYDIAG